MLYKSNEKWGADKHPIFSILKGDIVDGIKICSEIFGMEFCKCECFFILKKVYQFLQSQEWYFGIKISATRGVR